LVFVGDGKQKDQLVKQAQLDELDNCIFLDPVPKGTLAGYLQRADFGIMALDNVPAFYYGTSPNKFFDYLAAELPVVCNYPGWVSDMITENECGISCQPEEPIMLADTMIAMASADRSSMKVNAKKLAHRDFDRDKIADRLIGLFESVFRSNDKN
jgi:glycosyltransferase involved in cell wall biosynthesis